jgi:hypothetical protein
MRRLEVCNANLKKQMKVLKGKLVELEDELKRKTGTIASPKKEDKMDVQ